MLVVAGGSLDEDRLIEVALEAGADDVSGSDGNVGGHDPARGVRDGDVTRSRRRGRSSTSAEVTMVPSNTVPVTGDAEPRLLKLLDALDDHDDVQKVSVERGSGRRGGRAPERVTTWHAARTRGGDDGGEDGAACGCSGSIRDRG